MADEKTTFEGLHCTLSVERRAPRVIVVAFSGNDIGELGEAPFRRIESEMEVGPIELFIDARAAQGATIDVSGEWATWLKKSRERFVHVSMLTGSRFIKLSADFVKRFAEMGEVMRIYTDPVAFDEALAASKASAHRR